MNCREFEQVLPDLARAHVIGEAAQGSAFGHAANCPRCAARLADERALVEGLKGLAREYGANTPPARIETALLNAFRERGGASISAGGEASQAMLVSPLPVATRKHARLVYVGLAASVLLLVGWMVARRIEFSRNDRAKIQEAPAVAAPPSTAPSQPAAETPSAVTPVTTAAARTGSGRKTRERHHSRASEPASGSNDSHRENEIRTEFMPLMAVEPLSPSELRQLVRVRLPRSTVQTFGLPINMERSREPVEADVILSEDGRALAVRFVRE
jgi:hypothetical protein